MNKNIVINRKQLRLVEAMKEGFRLDMLLSLTSFKKRLDYCKKMLGDPIGKGSSRIVFQIDDETVLKLAYNRKGVAQNLQEINVAKTNMTSLTPNVYNGSDENNGLWIICDFVLQAEKEDFEKLLGISFPEIQDIVWATKINAVGRGNTHHAVQVLQLYYDRYEDNQDVIDIMDELHCLVADLGIEIGDFSRINNWGVALRGGYSTMVLLDAGLSDEVFDKYYRGI